MGSCASPASPNRTSWWCTSATCACRNKTRLDGSTIFACVEDVTKSGRCQTPNSWHDCHFIFDMLVIDSYPMLFGFSNKFSVFRGWFTHYFMSTLVFMHGVWGKRINYLNRRS